MIPKKRRLKSSQFKEVFNSSLSRSLSSSLLTLVYLEKKPKDLDQAQVSVVVPKKVVKKSVDRNKVKRRVYSANGKGFDHYPPIQAVLIVKLGVLKSSIDDIKIQVDEMVKKIKYKK